MQDGIKANAWKNYKYREDIQGSIMEYKGSQRPPYAIKAKKKKKLQTRIGYKYNSGGVDIEGSRSS